MKPIPRPRAAAPLIILLCVAAAGVPFLAFQTGANAFRWTWLGWACLCAAASSAVRGRPRLILANLAGAAGVLLVFELYCGGGLAACGLAPRRVSDVVESVPRDSVAHDESLGYAPIKNLRAAFKKTHLGETVYDVAYTIDEHGFRRMPSRPAGTRAVLFLGDSFTFGEGLNDDETFPSIFQSASGYKAINLAYRGYGPHQMLRILESGRERPAAASYRPFQAFYLFLPDQVARATGESLWDGTGPRYELDKDGTLRYRGPWRRRPHSFGAETAVRTLFRSSAILRQLSMRAASAMSAPDSEADDERCAAIIADAMRIFKLRYDGDFEVLLWPDATPRIKELLRGRNVPYIALGDAIPEIRRPESYIRYDGHPSAAMDRALGAYLARWVAVRRR